MDNHIENIQHWFWEAQRGNMWESTMLKNIEAEVELIKAEALEEAYQNGIAVPNESDSLREALGDGS